MDIYMKINIAIVAIGVIGVLGYFAWKGFTQWRAENEGPSLSGWGIPSRQEQIKRNEKLSAIRNKYRSQITRMKIADFFGAKDLDFVASDAIEKTEGNVIFVDFKAKKRAS